MPNVSPSVADWRCHACSKLLAKRQGNQIHIHVGQKYRYIVDGKVTSICPGCEALNSTQTTEELPPKN